MTPETSTSDIDYDTPAVLPDDDDGALDRIAWHARMARQAQAELDAMSDMYDAELARMIERRENRARIIMDRLNWHKAPIESYARMLLERNGTRTIELPHATSKMVVPKKAKVWLEPVDTSPGQMLEWLHARHPHVLRAPTMTEVRDLVEVVEDKVVDAETGEVLDFLTASVPDPRWSLDLDPGAPF